MDAALELLLNALSEQGDVVVLLDGDRVLAESPAAAPIITPEVRRALRPGAAPKIVEAPDGRSFELRRTTAGPLQAVVGREVTEREQLRLTVARSDEILSIGSHELKGPLHVIGMICHLIETRAARGEAVDQSTLDRLRRQVARLNRLLTELLDTSRLQEGRLFLEDEQVDLAELVREQLDSTIPARRVDVKCELPDEAPLHGDRTRLGAVCFQLIDNAVRFTQQGTEVRVRLDEADGHWRLTVTDRGPGVPPEEVGQLFQRQPRRRGERRTHGLGLGLYLAAAVVRMHRGTLEYAPVPRGGASFTARLPRR